MAKSKTVLILLLALFCIVVQVIPLIKSGLLYSFGIGYWGAMGHDGVWHQSLSAHISNPLSLSLPMYHFTPLQGYHPFYNIFVKTVSTLTSIPLNLIIFQIFPLVTAILSCFLSYRLGKMITKSTLGGALLMFLNTTANSFGWIVSLLKNSSVSGESMFWAMQSPSNQINPPFQLSIVLILALLYLLFKYQNFKKLKLTHIVAIILILIVLPITKVYSAPIGFGLFAFYSLYNFTTFKNTQPFFVLTVSVLLSAALFFNYNRNSISLVEFHPFWFVNSLFESPDRLYIPRLANMRYTLEASGTIGPRLVALQLFGLVVFIIGNFGWRILGFVPQRKFKLLNFSLNALVLISILIPTLFIQKGTSWNTIQFIYYGLFLGNISLMLFLVSLKPTYQKIMIFIIAVSSIVPLFGSIPQYIGAVPPAAIPTTEVSALKFLSKSDPGIVLTVPYDAYQKFSFEHTPIPLYAYETTSYVSGYSGHPTFLEDEMNLGNSGIDFKPQLNASARFFEQKNTFQDRGFLLNNQIDYIYMTGLQISKYPLNIQELYLKEIYNQEGTIIYRVLR